MSIPTHHDKCKTRIWKTICASCGKRVYFFSCTCGSAVYFEECGPPWTLHLDNCPGAAIRDVYEQGQLSGQQIRQRIEREERILGKAVSSDIWQLINQLDGGHKTRGVIAALPNELTDVDGEVFRVNTHVNFFTRYSLPNNSISRGILGDLVTQPHAEIVLREDAETDRGLIFEFTFFISLRLFQRSGVRTGGRGHAHLYPFLFPQGQKVWLADLLETN